MGELEAVNFDTRSNNDSRFLDHLVGEANKYNPPFVERHPCQALSRLYSRDRGFILPGLN